MSKILVIEDEDNIRELISDILEAEDFEVLQAANGREGVDLARSHSIALILCDIMMPELNGYDVLAQVRGLPNLATVPFIFLTAKVNRADIRQGMDWGADDYLTKPFSRQELLNAIRARLQKQANVGKHYQQRLEELRQNIAQALPHELLTPLNGLMGLSSILKTDYQEIEPDDLAEIVNGIYSSARRLDRVIQNTLMYSKLRLISEGQAKDTTLTDGVLYNAEFNITWTAQRCAERLHRDADLSLAIEDSVLAISEQAIHKIVEELVDNACKFSEPGTPIHLIGRIVGDRYHLALTNQGRGMSPDQIAGVGAYQQFERKFYEQQGTGLGLVIVRQLVDLYQGELTISSQPDLETTVQIVVGLAPADALVDEEA